MAKLEIIAHQLDLSNEQLQHWNQHLNQYSEQFYRELPDAPTYYDDGNTGERIEEFTFEEEPRPIELLVKELHQALSKTALNAASPRHLGYINGGGLYATAVGDYIASITNVFSGIYYVGPAAVRIENQLIRWMAQLAGYPLLPSATLPQGAA